MNLRQKEIASFASLMAGVFVDISSTVIALPLTRINPDGTTQFNFEINPIVSLEMRMGIYPIPDILTITLIILIVSYLINKTSSLFVKNLLIGVVTIMGIVRLLAGLNNIHLILMMLS